VRVTLACVAHALCYAPLSQNQFEVSDRLLGEDLIQWPPAGGEKLATNLRLYAIVGMPLSVAARQLFAGLAIALSTMLYPRLLRGIESMSWKYTLTDSYEALPNRTRDAVVQLMGY
jgi:hypothetical protein